MLLKIDNGSLTKGSDLGQYTNWVKIENVYFGYHIKDRKGGSVCS